MGVYHGAVVLNAVAVWALPLGDEHLTLTAHRASSSPVKFLQILFQIVLQKIKRPPPKHFDSSIKLNTIISELIKLTMDPG